MIGQKKRNEKKIIRELGTDEQGNMVIQNKVEYINPRYNGPDAEVCAWDIWQQMPTYDPWDRARQYGLDLTFESHEDLNKLIEMMDLDVTERTRVAWYPADKNPHLKKQKRYWVGDKDSEYMPRHPVYIISKSRFERRPTSDALCKMKVPHYIVVEEHQYEDYKSRVDPEFVTVLILDKKYQDEYDTFDDLGYQKSKGPGAARNFAWEHSISIGATHHWVLDDNATHFQRMWRDKRPQCWSPAILRAMEDHMERYDNVYIAGPNYSFFAVPHYPLTPIVFNTRIYSFLLIRNDIVDNEGKPYRWRGRYNEDTDLSLRVLKDGHATMQYNAFLANKMPTQVLKGGNTEAFYSSEGTRPKSEMLVKMHPDVAEVVWKTNRWHHYVDYTPFKSNPLGLKPEYQNLPDEPNEYGMRLVIEDVDQVDDDDQMDELNLVHDDDDDQDQEQSNTGTKKPNKPRKLMTEADMSNFRAVYQNLDDIPEEAIKKPRRFILSCLTKEDMLEFREKTGFEFRIKPGILVKYHVDFNNPKSLSKKIG